MKAQLGPFTVIWDGSNIHSRAKVVKEYLAKHPEIVVGTLPAYAPELNPDKGVWGWTRYGRLTNLAAAHPLELPGRLETELSMLREDHHLLDSFIRESILSQPA